MNIALIAHDRKKHVMIEFAKKFEQKLSQHRLYATGTTGKVVMESTQLSI